ncbi:MAG: fibrobacter succinogenes major paralogous domain-containing protein [Fibrobacter sp.]|uniref:fibrobacter succinogenes major paralogous domain-containing protein n=1 Tax=Fibrobacter sp. TaxID=35828 RepID=UPI001B286AAF|nr:fibrobacter succinogenes major paralogous domain-containing protein [Fibrobacter sp.]MBO7061437.1 fibrobacter succinogenes major paralogous domain-containing protein [Fibrobacter sp.]
MTLKKIHSLAASALLVAAFSACSSDDGSPAGSGNELGALDGADVVAAQPSRLQAPDEKIPDVNEASESQGALSSSSEEITSSELAVPVADALSSEGESIVEPESSSDVESSASLDSILAILFPDGINGIDTARHEPDSVGVWHFYDPRGTHDNPNFAYGEMTDPRDGMVYKTTTIGGMTWMAENLNYFDIEGAASSVKNDWCYWDKPENCESAGRLYTWKVAQRICPEGWRLPTNEDWAALLTAVGADSVNEILWTGSSKLKSVSGWENDGSGTDDFGFTALPAGMKFISRTQDGFTYHGCSSLMWASTEADGGAADSLAYHMYLDCSNDNAIVNTVKKIDGLSVRCVKE